MIFWKICFGDWPATLAIRSGPTDPPRPSTEWHTEQLRAEPAHEDTIAGRHVGSPRRPPGRAVGRLQPHDVARRSSAISAHRHRAGEPRHHRARPPVVEHLAHEVGGELRAAQRRAHAADAGLPVAHLAGGGEELGAAGRGRRARDLRRGRSARRTAQPDRGAMARASARGAWALSLALRFCLRRREPLEDRLGLLEREAGVGDALAVGGAVPGT